MFPKCSLDVLNIAKLWEHSANIPGILRASWVRRNVQFLYTLKTSMGLGFLTLSFDIFMEHWGGMC